MEIKDLMLYDWVQVPSELNRFKQIKSTFDMDEAVLYQPIPLTAEILEKNGFVDCHTISEKFELRIHLDKDNYQVVSYYFGLTALSIKTEYSYYLSPTIDRLKIKYVHELQHALKSCNIDKEIVL